MLEFSRNSRSGLGYGKGLGFIDNIGPTNISGDLPDKKSQPDLRPFGVRVPVMGSTLVP